MRVCVRIMSSTLYIPVLYHKQLQISNGTNSDFFGTNLVATFPDGTTSISAIITIRNDAVPEGNETFILQITGTRFGAEVGSQSTMALVIRASDEPHGAVQFDPVSENNCCKEIFAISVIIPFSFSASYIVISCN